MKKIAFVVPHMLCGGVEKGLLTLINELPKSDYDITIYMVKAEGEFIGLIPNHVKKQELPLKKSVRDDLMLGGIKASLKTHLKKFNLIKISKISYGIITKDPLATLTCNFENIEEIKESFDVAICFHLHMPFIVRYVAEKFHAKKKLAWIHNDFKMSGYSIQGLDSYLDQYNHFFAVSKQLREEFIEMLPQYKHKISVAHNIISENYIRSCLDGERVPEYLECDSLKILTVGRLDKQKGYDMAIEVCEELVELGYKFKWFVLGSGAEEKSLRKMIKDKGLDKIFILLGTRENPYPYMEQCDIYIQPSRHEGYGIAVAEARVLAKPIICTNFAGAKEQLNDKITGRIVDFDKSDLVQVISEYIENERIREYYERNLRETYIDTVCEVEKISMFF